MLRKDPIIQTFSSWYRRTFADPAAVKLFLTILFSILILKFFGDLLLPILVSVVIAYLLASIVRALVKIKIPHLLAAIIVFVLFIGVVGYLLFILMPILGRQLSNLINELPTAFTKGQYYLNELMQRYPSFFSPSQLDHVTSFLRDQSMHIGQIALRYSLASIPSLIIIIVYLILVPLLVFFFLKDSQRIMRWFDRYLPSDRGLVVRVWKEMQVKVGAYVRGRVIEVFIIGIMSTVAFGLLGLQYYLLLGSLVGLSVIVPYIGAILVTIPVVLVALMEWGISAHFIYLVLAFGAIITFDANILVPLLFSEVMDLHPIVIILAVIIFGGIWGFWGIFFAIPLATLVDTILKAWPKKEST